MAHSGQEFVIPVHLRYLPYVAQVVVGSMSYQCGCARFQRSSVARRHSTAPSGGWQSPLTFDR